MKVEINEQKIQKLLTRGVENIYPSISFLEHLLKSGTQLKLYLGIDPTGPTLHIGHAIPLSKLKQFQDLGHKVILLIGSFTAMIGDPDKASVRNQLTKEQVEENMKLYLEQASKIIDTTDPDIFEIRYNDEWLAKMNFEQVIELASKMTVQQMLERDMFEKRMKEGKPIYIHEFMYPLMQGYDSIALGVDGEIGGNDQTFNMLTGRTLVKEMTGREKFVITTKLLTDPTGVKMGKSEGNMITLKDTATDMFGKVMSWTDGMITLGFELCTDISMEEIEKIKNNLNDASYNPKEAKMFLAHEIVKKYFDDDQAKSAQDNFENTFKKGELPEHVEEILFMDSFGDTLVSSGVVTSKSEYRRLIEQGAITDVETDVKITDPSFVPEKTSIYRIGKHRFVKIVMG